MAKYNYDKSILNGLGVGAFLGEVGLREKEIAKGENSIPTSIYNPNVLAAKLHPSVQYGVVSEIRVLADSKIFIIGPDEEKGTKELAYFRAGQYVSFALEIGNATVCKPYTIASGPKLALGEKDNKYCFVIKKCKDGYASEYILNNWDVGTKVTMSGPLGDFYYQGLRDAKTVVALAGGSGITPFISMAQAIVDETENFNITIIYGSRSHDSILLKNELKEIELRSDGKVKVVHVLSDDDAEGFEHGNITSELIKKYAPSDDYSIFVCGPKAMYKFLENELSSLELPRRRIRYELSGEYKNPAEDAEFPSEAVGKEFNLKVWVRGESKDLKCKSEETLLHTMEQAGIKVPSDCRSGQCGWCHSRLISGEIYVPKSADGRREADRKFGWVHPCATFPLSDIEIEVFPMSK